MYTSWISWSLTMRHIGCPETSVRYYNNTLRNISEERRTHLLGGRSLKSRTDCSFNTLKCSKRVSATFFMPTYPEPGLRWIPLLGSETSKAAYIYGDMQFGARLWPWAQLSEVSLTLVTAIRTVVCSFIHADVERKRLVPQRKNKASQ
jgi:hypothetical protein